MPAEMATLRGEQAQFRVWKRWAFRVAVQEELSLELLPMAEREVSYVKEQGHGYSVEKEQPEYRHRDPNSHFIILGK